MFVCVHTVGHVLCVVLLLQDLKDTVQLVLNAFQLGLELCVAVFSTGDA